MLSFTPTRAAAARVPLPSLQPVLGQGERPTGIHLVCIPVKCAAVLQCHSLPSLPCASFAPSLPSMTLQYYPGCFQGFSGPPRGVVRWEPPNAATPQDLDAFTMKVNESPPRPRCRVQALDCSSWVLNDTPTPARRFYQCASCGHRVGASCKHFATPPLGPRNFQLLHPHGLFGLLIRAAASGLSVGPSSSQLDRLATHSFGVVVSSPHARGGLRPWAWPNKKAG